MPSSGDTQVGLPPDQPRAGGIGRASAAIL